MVPNCWNKYFVLKLGAFWSSSSSGKIQGRSKLGCYTFEYSTLNLFPVWLWGSAAKCFNVVSALKKVLSIYGFSIDIFFLSLYLNHQLIFHNFWRNNHIYFHGGKSCFISSFFLYDHLLHQSLFEANFTWNFTFCPPALTSVAAELLHVLNPLFQLLLCSSFLLYSISSPRGITHITHGLVLSISRFLV